MSDLKETIEINGKSVTIPTGLFIGGEFVKPKDGKKFGVVDPRTGKDCIQVYEGQAEDVDIAVKKARDVFESDEYQNLGGADRGALIHKLADLMEANKEEIIAVEMLDTGKTYKQASTLDFPGSVGTMRYYAGWADKILGQHSNNVAGTFAYVRKEPVGVCGQIIPWNFPLLMFIWKITPAFITGNTVVIKTAETTPLAALYICRLIQEAGFPKGSINLVSGFGKTVGAAIGHHMDIDKVAFTGSTVTGRAILKASAASNLKKVTLELGGKSPNIIFPDADLEKAVEWSAWGINMNYGQTCHAGTRIYVHDDVYDKFCELFTARMKKVKVGDNFDESTDQGPQNSKIQHDKIKSYLDIGKKEGATIALGGEAHGDADGSNGYWIQPTIFTNVKPSMRIVQEEIFGPVVTVHKFTDEKEVIRQANDTTYGLAAGIHTKDYERAVRVTNKLKAGTLWVNMFNFVHWSLPFGGYKQSGLGRECGDAVLENYLETKTVYFNMGIPAPS